MIPYELIGFIAIVLVLLPYTQFYRPELKYINLAGAVLFICYGFIIHAVSVWVLGILFIVLHAVNLFLRHYHVDPGCIIIGYPGIGKSTLSSVDNDYIDLESSLFIINGERIENWYEYYCLLAIDLASQGYRVFVSSHFAVREYLCHIDLPCKLKLFACYPDISIQDAWIEKLQSRYNKTHLDKDLRSLHRAEDHYKEDIQSLEDCNCIPIVIKHISSYNLRRLIEVSISKHR